MGEVRYGVDGLAGKLDEIARALAPETIDDGLDDVDVVSRPLWCVCSDHAVELPLSYATADHFAGTCRGQQPWS